MIKKSHIGYRHERHVVKIPRGLLFDACSIKPISEACNWKNIKTAPKDGTKILGFGLSERSECGSPLSSDQAPILSMRIIWWVEGWYDKEIMVYKGLYKKVPVKSFAYWNCQLGKLEATHWMPLPKPPVNKKNW